MRPSLVLPMLCVLAAMLLAGCAAPVRAPEPPPVAVSEETWWRIDRDILSAAEAATGPATAFAHKRMEAWRQRVTQRTEADFIPWFSSYWAQQWMTAKVAWYSLNAEPGSEAPTSRLAAYLQAQYHERVLAPVAAEIDPLAVIDQATRLYLFDLGGRLQEIPGRYGVPPVQFRQHLAGIAAIVPTAPGGPGASLQQLLADGELERSPAYVALLRQVRDSGPVAAAGLSKERISPVAARISESMVQRVAISGAASAVSSLVGGVAGSVISLGATGIGMMVHESGRGDVEAELRTVLNASTDEVWLLLMGDAASGVTAGVHRLAVQIDRSLVPSLEQPTMLVRPPEQRLLPDLPPPAAAGAGPGQ